MGNWLLQVMSQKDKSRALISSPDTLIVVIAILLFMHYQVMCIKEKYIKFVWETYEVLYRPFTCSINNIQVLH